MFPKTFTLESPSEEIEIVVTDYPLPFPYRWTIRCRGLYRSGFGERKFIKSADELSNILRKDGLSAISEELRILIQELRNA
jgi:hypothetical protein